MKRLEQGWDWIKWITEFFDTWVKLFALIAFVIALPGAVYLWIKGPIEEPVTLAFNLRNACEDGRLSGLVERSLRGVGTDGLLEGAASMTLCLDEPVTDVPSKLPEKIATLLPGCLSHQSWNNSLVMQSNAQAVCKVRLQGQAVRYFCKGIEAASRRGPSGADLVEPTGLPECSDAFLRRIGR